MACGTPVIASDLQVLREVGGDAAEYCGVGDIGNWADTAARLLSECATGGEAWQRRRARGIQRASRFTWSQYAAHMAAIYSELLAANYGSGIGAITDASVKPKPALPHLP